MPLTPETQNLIINSGARLCIFGMIVRISYYRNGRLGPFMFFEEISEKKKNPRDNHYKINEQCDNNVAVIYFNITYRLLRFLY